MLRDAAVSIIANRLGQRTGLEAQIIAEMQLAQAGLEGAELMPWFLLNIGTLNLNGQILAVPTGFLREPDDFGVWLLKTDGGRTQLLKDNYDVLQASVQNEEIEVTAEDPTHYAIVGSTIYFFPTPTRAGVVTFPYYKAADTLATNIENLWLANAPEVLIAKTGLPVARFLRDIEAVKLFASDLSDAMTRLLHAHIAREQAARLAFIGG